MPDTILLYLSHDDCDIYFYNRRRLKKYTCVPISHNNCFSYNFLGTILVMIKKKQNYTFILRKNVKKVYICWLHLKKNG